MIVFVQNLTIFKIQSISYQQDFYDKIRYIFNHFFFFFFLVSTINGFEGKILSGKRIDPVSSFISISVYCSGKHSPIDRDLISTPTFPLANFYFILVTSSNWFNRYFDFEWFRITSESPLFLDEYWQIDGAVSLSSNSCKLSIF